MVVKEMKACRCPCGCSVWHSNNGSLCGSCSNNNCAIENKETDVMPTEDEDDTTALAERVKAALEEEQRKAADRLQAALDRQAELEAKRQARDKG